MPNLLETDLYQPLKRFLECQGYSVKGEVSNCDIVAVRGDEELVIIELKTTFSLQLVLQGIRRQSMTDHVYLAFAVHKGHSEATIWRRQYRDILKLCRMLGLGLITVHFNKSECRAIETHLDPAPYRPRKSKNRRATLLREFQRRIGDPNKGGTSKRPIVTAYRQDALRCACFLDRDGPSRAVVVKTQTGVDRAPRILLNDHYGWFQRIARGTYALTPNGKRALDNYADVVETLT